MRTLDLLCLTLACAALAQGDARESRTVQTAQGPVRGYKTDGVFKFYGIPYATAPTGTKRFTAPLGGPVWMQTLEAINNKIICPQGNMLTPFLESFIMQENCLVANVHMPDTEETNLPVLVYVHGGGYNLGWGDLTAPHTLVKSKKIVAVSFNYRLGAHGFLCLGTEDAPGNAGMKDQVALLRWVKRNIANFGGNPDDVTIAGGSAGAAAVDLLMLSKMSEGLFNKVIPESGSNIAVWSIQQDPVQNAKDFAMTRNVTNTDDIDDLLEFYTTSSYDALISEDFSTERIDSAFYFAPCVERDVGQEPFLKDSPLNILKQGNFKKVPVLYGFANMEGLTRLPNFEQWKDQMNKKFSDFLPADLQFKSEEEKASVAQTVKKFYFGNQNIEEDNIEGFIDFFSDVMFTYSQLRSAQLQVEAGSNSVYLYMYTFYSPPIPAFSPPPYAAKLRGASHCAQSGAIHDGPFEYPDDREVYLNLRKTLREMWLNFIITGKPVPESSDLPEWPAVGANGSPYMELGEEIKLRGPLLEDRFNFWKDIYERYYRPPVPPTSFKTRSEL